MNIPNSEPRFITSLKKASPLSPGEFKKPYLDLADEMFLSLFMQYDQNLLELLKTTIPKEKRRWNPDKKCWSIHVSETESVIDLFDANIFASFNLLKKFNLSTEKKALPPLKELPGQKFCTVEWRKEDQRRKELAFDHFLKKKLLSHQAWGASYLVENLYAALLDEMGCGKSLQVIAAISHLFEEKEIDRCIVICPLSLVPMWQKEIEESCYLKPKILSKKDDIKKIKDESVFIFHYEFLRTAKEALIKELISKNSILIFDESQRIKNLQSQTTKAALEIRKYANRCVILTGSPIANRPLDLFAQYFVLDNGETFGEKISNFKNTYCIMDKFEVFKGRKRFFIERYVDTKNKEQLSHIMLHHSLRRTKDEVLDLPDLLSKTYYINLSSIQEKLYKEIKQGILQDISVAQEEDAPQTKIENILTKMIKLIQAATNANLLFDNVEESFPKLEALDDLLENYFLDPTKKVILWSHFVKNVQFLHERYEKKYGAVAHFGQMDLEERQIALDTFRSTQDSRLIILTPQSAKEGLTLLPKNLENSVVDLMVYFDHNFDAASFVQSRARFHRIGQKAQKCYVINFIAKDTIEEYILKVLNDKLQTAMKIFNDVNLSEVESNESFKWKMDDIEKILRSTI